MKLFFDVNVVLDVLTAREPWAHDSATAMSLLELEEMDGMIAAHAVTTIHYLVSRSGRNRANGAVLDLLHLFEIASVDESSLAEALALEARDFEDAVQAVCAVRSGADCFVTRNPDDYRDFGMRVFTPTELLAYLEATGN